MENLKCLQLLRLVGWRREFTKGYSGEGRETWKNLIGILFPCDLRASPELEAKIMN